MPHTLVDVCRRLEKHGFAAEIVGDRDREIVGVATLEDATDREISFLSNPKYERMLGRTQAAAVVLKPGVVAPDELAQIRVDDPYAAITALIVELHGYRKHRAAPDRTDDTRIAPSAIVGENATIYPGVTIDEDVRIGRNVVLYPGVYVGPRCQIGDDVICYPNVVLYDDTRVGNRVTLHAGTVVGNDGLGYAPVNGKWIKIPQIGHVEIEDDVEIGSNCSIDRATLGRTRVGRGTKMSNLIAIGHGTHVGEDCMIVAQVGLAGSVTVGNHVTLAGQAGIVGHISIGDHATVGAKAGVTNNVEANETVLGQPAVPITEAKRRVLSLGHLPELRQKVRQMQKELDALREQVRGRAT